MSARGLSISRLIFDVSVRPVGSIHTTPFDGLDQELDARSF